MTRACPDALQVGVALELVGTGVEEPWMPCWSEKELPWLVIGRLGERARPAVSALAR